MEYPHGFDGFQDAVRSKETHTTHEELQSYSERALRSSAEIGEDEFAKFENHTAYCDGCLKVLITSRIQLLGARKG